MRPPAGHASQFAELSTVLKRLLPRLEHEVRHASKAGDRRAVHALRARAYQAVAAAFARQDEPNAAWVAADRAMGAAELAEAPLEVVAGHFRLAHAFIRLRRFDQAEHVVQQAIDVLRPAADDDTPLTEVLSLYGAMHLVQAIIADQEGERTQARRILATARRVAERVGEGRNDFATEFGPTNVQLHAVAVDLGDAGEALDIASQVDASVLSPERQARFRLDVARAQTQRRHIGEATAAIIEAQALAPEHIRSHHLARSTTVDLPAIAGRRGSKELLDLADRVGAR